MTEAKNLNIIPVYFRTFSRISLYFSVIFLLAAGINAATFTVTKTADTNDGVCDADCSLREAIAAANAATSDDVIEFDPVVFATAQTITLSGDTFAIAANGTLTINGTSATRLTLNGNNTKRLFYFMSQSNLTLRRMTLTNGGGQSSVVLVCGGGAILSDNSVSRLEDVIVSNSRTFQNPGGFCYGGGIYNTRSSAMTVLRSRVEGNVNNPANIGALGGGIFNAGTMTISESSITSNINRPGSGGGIANLGGTTLNLINTTISGNSAPGSDGGGIWNAGVVNATHSTIVNNLATTFGAGVVTLSNSEIGGAFFNSRNSIYANNFSGENNTDFNGPMISGGYNFIENPNNAFITGDTTGNILGQDPQVQPLASVGNGITLAHKPSPSSPVIDKGKTFGIFADQRSVNRPFDLGGYPNAPGGDGADIGAIEMQLTDFSKAPLFDFDGDRKTDVAVLRSGSDWWINRSSNGQTSAASFGTANDIRVPADYTGDGKTDIAIYRPSNSIWYILRSENSTFYAFPFGINGDVPVAGDFDGDSIYDQAIFRPSNGEWYIKRSSDAEISIQQFGIAEDKPVIADYDGDRKDDIAVFRPSTGAWWIQRSSAGLIAVQFGQTGDKTVQGDYTGDGKADVAFFRPSNGFWYILRSEDFSYYGYPFGSADDLPIPGDYDGDGKSDAAVYRPSSQGWYLMRSTAGVTSLQFGISGDYPIPNSYVR